MGGYVGALLPTLATRMDSTWTQSWTRGEN